MVQFAFTMDYDWASEAVLEYSLQHIIESNIPITLFATHDSSWINQMSIGNNNIEIEIHPNFCPNSSHGGTFNEVFSFCNNIRSDKKGFRCHKFYSINEVQEHYKEQGYLYSSNICADLEYIRPFRNRCGLIEIPIYMEDGGFLFQGHSIDIKTVISNIPYEEVDSGIVTIVFLFHPMHLAFNSNSFAAMKELKQSLTIQEYQNLSFEEIYCKRGKHIGINDLFEDVYNWSEAKGIKKVLLNSILNE